MKLPGCELELPLRFDKVSVFPGHKDRLALIRSSSVRIVTLQKSFEIYIVRFNPSSLPTDIDLSVSAYSWTVSGHFIFATRQGLLCTLDGTTGSILHACQVEQPITSIVVPSLGRIMTAHVGNTLQIWDHNAEVLAYDCSTRLTNAPMMESQAMYSLREVVDLDRMSQDHRPDVFLMGQVAHLQCTPDFAAVVLTTAEGEVWTFRLPERSDDGSSSMPIVHHRALDLQLQLATWFHTHPVADVCFLGQNLRLCASIDEGGRFRIWDLGKSGDPKGFRVLRFTSTLTSITATDEGNVVIIATAGGCLHAVDCSNWKKAYVADTVRISEAGIAQVCGVTHESRLMSIACSLFNNRLAFCTVSLRDPKIRMLGFVDGLGGIEDISFHTKDFRYEALTSPKLLVVSSYQHTVNENPWPCAWVVQAPPFEYDAVTAELKRDTCPTWSLKLPLDPKIDDKPTAVASASKKGVAIGFASGAVKIFPVPSNTGPPLSKQAPGVPIDTLKPHGELVTRVSISHDGMFLISSSMDGSVRFVSLDAQARSGELHKIIHNPYNGGVVQVCTDRDNTTFLSSGGSDGILVWSNKDKPFQLSPLPPDDDEDDDEALERNFGFAIDDKDKVAYPVWGPKAGDDAGPVAAVEADDPELNAVALAQRKALVLEVEGLRKKLRILVDANQHCPELEKMGRSEFCVDIEERDAISMTTKERCSVLRAEIEKENLARQLIRDRLIKEFWDPMRTKGCQINSLMSNLSVSNYPERVISDAEDATVKKLRLMRNVELLENQMLRGTDCPHQLRDDVVLKAEQFTTGKEGYIVNWWSGKKAEEAAVVKKTLSENAGEGEGGGEGGEGEAQKKKQETAKPDPQDQKLLYEPFELLTNSRRRLQIHLLQSLASEYRAQFNLLFKDCVEEKKNVLGEIKEKLQRIRGILGELQIEEEVPDVGVQDPEVVGSVLKVKDSEISVKKWISEEERRAIAEAEAKEAERLRQLRENDAGQRALMQMMGGTLKTKKDLTALEITLDREPWMDDIEYDDMTDVQKQLLKEFEVKEKELAEEQDKYRKQLDADMKRARQEVLECQQQFEVTLKELHHQRFEHDAKSFCQDLYCVRLQLALLQSVEDSHVLKQLMQDLHDAQTKLGRNQQQLEDFNEEYHIVREKQDEKVRHDREIGAAQHFRAQFANSGLENDIISTLLQMFRRRRGAMQEEKIITTGNRRGSQRRASGGGAPAAVESPSSQASPPKIQSPESPPVEDGLDSPPADPFDTVTVGDPYSDLGVGGSSEEAMQDDGLRKEQPDEMPEGVDEASFNRMLQLRAEKLQAEAEVQKGNSVLAEMNGLLAHLQQERDDAQADYDRLQAELTEHQQLMDRELYDIEILFKLKQGQVEVPQAAVVTDYSDAVVIGKEVVECRNRRILELGKEKVGTLGTTRDFRKKLNLIHWEHKMLAMQTVDLEERTKDVHMLRVTKNLQTLLKGGEEQKNKTDADLLERKIQHLEATTAQKEQSLKKQFGMSRHAADLRKQENSMLEKKLRELQQNVIQREHIRRLRAPQGGSGGQTGNEGQKPRIVGGGGRIEENEGAIRLAQTNFREVKTRQTLMDAAKKHTEEIELLRKELDRLRQKTFPSFVQLHEERPANPDHKGFH
jgi:WD40 repeat protein